MTGVCWRGTLLSIRQAMRYSPALKWYDMNFYVHQCSRMSYKHDFKPSEILCPVHGRWVSLDAAIPLLDANKYVITGARVTGEGPVAVCCGHPNLHTVTVLL